MKQIILTWIVFFAIFGISAASAVQLDYIVDAKMEQYQIELGQKPVAFGTVTDNVLRPVSGVEVRITFGANSATTITDSDGKFRQEFPEQSSPGIFSVNVFAKQGDKKGLDSTTLRISKQMTTFGEMYYNSELAVSDQKKSDPYQALKAKNYEKFLKEKGKAYQRQLDAEAKKMALQEKKRDGKPEP